MPVPGLKRINISCHGTVQGIGLRPIVKNLADRFLLNGYVHNRRDGVGIEVEGEPDNVDSFLLSLRQHQFRGAPSLDYTVFECNPKNDKGFLIKESNCSPSEQLISPPPDLGLCKNCRSELFEPDNRRYRYPFIACSQCGPRYGVIDSLPYDRERTSFSAFPLCAACEREYKDPTNRRYHAQTNSCAECGPNLELFAGDCHTKMSDNFDAIQRVVRAIQQGRVGIIKGVSGYQLVAAANNANAVTRLRQLKNRKRKPFALLYPSIESLSQHCALQEAEIELLQSPPMPLVLLKNPFLNVPASFSEIVPDLKHLMVMLPSNGIYSLLMRDYGEPLVVTSCNLSGNPIIYQRQKVIEGFANKIDFLLDHNLEIINPQDDSICQVIKEKTMLLRPGRGFSPIAFTLSQGRGEFVTRGAYLKNTIAVVRNEQMLLSQYIGDMGNNDVTSRQKSVEKKLLNLVDIHPELYIEDSHPDSIQREESKAVEHCLHHYAHAWAIMGEHRITKPFLAFTWDGLGYGKENNLWGGECFLMDGSPRRVASLLPIRLLGGDTASREPKRTALVLLREVFGDDAIALHKKCCRDHSFTDDQYTIFCQLLDQKINTPECSSMGRLFDGLASLLNLCHVNTYEAEAAMILQSGALSPEETDFLESDNLFELRSTVQSGEELLLIDWRPCIRFMKSALESNKNIDLIVPRVFSSLARVAIDIAQAWGVSAIGVSGGCFQNRVLLEWLNHYAEQQGVSCYWPQVIPANDSGIAYGQAVHYVLEALN